MTYSNGNSQRLKSKKFNKIYLKKLNKNKLIKIRNLTKKQSKSKKQKIIIKFQLNKNFQLKESKQNKNQNIKEWNKY